MANFSELDKCLNQYLRELRTWSPERMIQLNLETLQRLNLLDFQPINQEQTQLTRYFQVAETVDKITLVNEDFIIWIVPELVNSEPVTYTFIALNSEEQPRLELTFVAKGVYNSSPIIMRALEKMLEEIQENEELLTRYKNI